MGTLIAVVIIIALIFYAVKDLLTDKDFSAWTNIALTSLILFTVILSIFMIRFESLDNTNITKSNNQTVPAKQTETAEPSEIIMSEEEQTRAKNSLADDYVLIESDCIKNNTDIDCSKAAADFMINKYKFTDEEWQGYFMEAQLTGLFDQARERQNINYLIKK